MPFFCKSLNTYSIKSRKINQITSPLNLEELIQWTIFSINIYLFISSKTLVFNHSKGNITSQLELDGLDINPDESMNINNFVDVKIFETTRYIIIVFV